MGSAVNSGKINFNLGFIYAIAILPAFLFTYFSFTQLFTVTFATVASIGGYQLFNRNRDELLSALFFFLLAFLTIVALGKPFPWLAPAAWGVWAWRNCAALYKPNPENSSSSIRRLLILFQFSMGWAAAFILIEWSLPGRGGVLVNAAVSAFMSAAALFFSRNINVKENSFWCEVAAVGCLAIILRLNPENLIFAQSPYFPFAVSLAVAVSFYKLQLLGRVTAAIFAFFGTFISVSAGTDAFWFYFVIILISYSGYKIRNKSAGMITPRLFIAGSSTAFLLSGISIFADNPFPFYIAIAGSFCAVIFSHWAELLPEQPPKGEAGSTAVSGWRTFTPLKNILLGFTGSTLAALGTVLTAFLPSGMMAVLIASSVTPMAYPKLKGLLAKPERDAIWLTPVMGAVSAFLLSKLFFSI